MLGVSPQAVSCWEWGRKSPTAAHAVAYGRLLAALATAGGLNVGTGPPARSPTGVRAALFLAPEGQAYYAAGGISVFSARPGAGRRGGLVRRSVHPE